jgi:hypothetical protein
MCLVHGFLISQKNQVATPNPIPAPHEGRQQMATPLGRFVRLVKAFRTVLHLSGLEQFSSFFSMLYFVFVHMLLAFYILYILFDFMLYALHPITQRH